MGKDGRILGGREGWREARNERGLDRVSMEESWEKGRKLRTREGRRMGSLEGGRKGGRGSDSVRDGSRLNGEKVVGSDNEMERDQLVEGSLGGRVRAREGSVDRVYR